MTITDEQKKQFVEIAGQEQVRSGELITLGQKQFEAELYKEVSSVEELAKTIIDARTLAIPYYILGLGFEPNDTDEIAGLVIKNNCRKFAILSMRGKIKEGLIERELVYVSAESGVQLNQLVRFTLEEGLSGLESFLGISGTIGDCLMGDTIYESKESLVERIFTVRLLTKENESTEVNAEPFLYPVSENIVRKKQLVPLSIVFQLITGNKNELWKKGTKAAFERNQSDLMDPLKGNFQI